MGVLHNPQHERFCQELHKLIWAGGKVKESRASAYQVVGYQTKPEYVIDNARKLANRPDVRARLDELAQQSAVRASCDAGWAMMQIKAFVTANIDDYLSPPDSDGQRYTELGNVSRDKLGLLSELSQEETTEPRVGDELRSVRKVKLKLHDKIAALRLMAEIAGWKAPAKVAATNPDGTQSAPLQVIEIVRFTDAPAKDTAAA